MASMMMYVIGSNKEVIDGVDVYNFSPAISFWIGAAIISMVLAALLWNVKPKD